MKKFIKKKYQKFKILFYKRILSDKVDINKYPNISAPLLLKGKGKFLFGDKIYFGAESSPFFYNYYYLEARNKDSVIEIEDNVRPNNNFTIIAEGKGDSGGVLIKKNTLIGFNVTIMDSDFHDLDPLQRMNPDTIKTAKVIIGENVFIGSNVTILKGVNIGDNSVVAAGSVVTKSFPKNVIIAGNPAKIIKEL